MQIVAKLGWGEWGSHPGHKLYGAILDVTGKRLSVQK